MFIPLILLSFFASSAKANVETKTVVVVSELQCRVDGVSLGKETFKEDLQVKIYPTTDGNSFWGVGEKSFNYPHSAKVVLHVFNPQRTSMKLPYRYAFNFGTMIQVANGVSRGSESSIIYIDSFEDFSPVYESGFVQFGQDDENFCSTKTVISPKNEN